jgi:hypothetical protein
MTFIRMPWIIYRDDPNWVPPLIQERKNALSSSHPFFEHADWQSWVAYQDGEPVGRISAQIDRLFLEHHDEATGFFGLIEAQDDMTIFDALFREAEQWLRDKGMKKITGPFNLGINQEVGLLVEGFETPPFIMMGHGRPYYSGRIESLGYSKAIDVLAYLLDADNFRTPPFIERLLRRKGDKIHVRPLDRKNVQSELELMRDVFNDAWARNWGFVPFTRKEFELVGKELLRLLPNDFIQIAEVDSEPAAFCALLPNINEVIADLDGKLFPTGWARLFWRLKVRFPKTARIPLMGVRRKFQNTRLGPGLAFTVIKALEEPGRAKGLEQIEMSWILEDNMAMRNIIEQVGGTQSKRYRMYHKDLAQE